MNKTLLKELKLKDELAHLVRVEAVELTPSKKGGDPWLTLTLGDSSGRIYAKKFGSSEAEFDRYKSAKYLFVTGVVEPYNGKISYKLSSLAMPGDDITEEEYQKLEYAGGGSKGKSKDSAVADVAAFTPVTKDDIDFENHLKAQSKLKPLKPGDDLNHILRLVGVEAKETKNNSSYVEAKVSDSTLELAGKKWDTDPTIVANFENIKAVYIRGKVDEYKGKIGFRYEELHPITDATENDISGLFVSSSYDPTFLYKGILELINKIENPWIKTLCKNFLRDEEFKERFKLVPAGVSKHHSFRHGLLEHTYRLMVFADWFVSSYNNLSWPGNKVFVNKDGVIAGCFLHDAYKSHEYETDGTYAVEGNKLGHIARGVMEIGAKCAAIPNFPTEEKELLAHIVAAHHLRKDWGSPDTPCCPEAIIVHYLDDLCSKLDPTILALNDLPKGSKWTENRVAAIEKQAYLGLSIVQEDEKTEE